MTDIDFLHPYLIGAATPSEAGWLADLATYASSSRAYAQAVRGDVFAMHVLDLGRAATALHQRLTEGGAIVALGDESGVGAVAALGRAGAASPTQATRAPDATPAGASKGRRAGTRLVPADQLVRRAHPGDVAMVFCAGRELSGLSAALEQARQRNLLTIGFLCDRSPLLDAPLDICFVVRAEMPERIREAHAALVWNLWSRLQEPRR